MEENRFQDEAGRAASRRWLAGTVGNLVVAGLLLLVLVYHVAPLLPSPLPVPELPSVLLQRAEEEFSEADFNVTPAIIRDSRQAVEQAPLAATPFYYAAMELDESNESAKIIALLDETLKRDPRHYYARLWRARMYYKVDRLPEAIAEIGRVVALDNSNTDAYMDALVDLAKDPRSHSFLLQRVAEGARWANDFIRRANAISDDEDFLFALASKSKTALNDYVQKVADRGDYERAFLIWQGGLTEDQLLAFSWPVDPRFSPQAEPAAFGWRVGSGLATREEDGLYTYFNGRSEKAIASQMLLLGPGYAYALKVLMSGEIDARGGFFQWTLACIGSNTIIATLPVRAIDGERKAFSIETFVPEEGCAAQMLTLTARPGEYPYPARVTAHEVTIEERATTAPTSDATPAVTPAPQVHP